MINSQAPAGAPALPDRPQDRTPATSPMRATVTQAFLWVGTGTFVGQLCSWISTIIVIRLLTPSDYGLMAMCTSFIFFLFLVSDLGVGASLIQASEITREEIRNVFGLVILCSLGFALFGHFAAPLIADFYNEPRVATLIRVTNLTFLLTALYTVPQSLAVRQLDFRLKAQVDTGAQVGAALLMVALAFAGAGVWTLVIGTIAGHAVKAVAFNVPRRLRHRPRFDFRSIKSFVRFGLTVTGDRLAYYLHSVSDTVIVGRVLGNTILGTYSLAITLSHLPAEKILPILMQVSFASYSRIQTDREAIGDTILGTLQAVSVVAFPAYFLMAAVAPEVLVLLLGERWAPIVLPFQLLCLILPFKALGPLMTPAVFATGKPMVNLVNMMINFIVMGAAFLVGVRHGIAGVAAAWACVYPFVFLVTSWRSLRALGLTLGAMFREIWFPLVASTGMLGVVMGLKHTAVLATVPALAVLAVAALGSYAALLVTFRREECVRLKGFLFG